MERRLATSAWHSIIKQNYTSLHALPYLYSDLWQMTLFRLLLHPLPPPLAPTLHMTIAIHPSLVVLIAWCGIVTNPTTAEFEQYGFYPHQISFSLKTEHTDCGFLQGASLNFYLLQKNRRFILYSNKIMVDRDSSVGIATSCGLDGPGIESRLPPDWRWGPPIQWVPGLSRG